MSRYSYVILIIATISISSCTQKAIDAQDVLGNTISTIQSKLIYRECQDLPNKSEVSIALIKDHQTIFYGIKRENDTIFTSQNKENVFQIGSVTKIFTTTLLADFIVNNKIELNEEIQNHLNFPIKNNPGITFQHLANHTSGISKIPSNINLWNAQWQNPYKDYDRTDLKEYLTQKAKLEGHPGEKFIYSNTGMALLGLLLSDISRTSYEELLRSKIFSPYHMSHSTSVKDKINQNIVVGLNSKGREIKNWDLDVMTPAGGVLSTVHDLSKFVSAHLDHQNEVLKLTRTQTYSGYDSGQKFKVGLGWMLKEKNGKELYWHNGGTSGFTSSVQFDKKYKTGVVILSNVSGISKKRVNIESLSDRLLETLYE